MKRTPHPHGLQIVSQSPLIMDVFSKIMSFVVAIVIVNLIRHLTIESKMYSSVFSFPKPQL
jgi:hypothetical protein